ncbi:hypothetical protein PR202_ga03221 [Eleusine coracana subsp. coracana]|uniref:Uncharacterized protein n=1 Tax=Eleusine coracana subsp. coracana TaxID=191504 RepID=A0AAV5BMV1_ELECO|nr:hypothetical protein PR202_ga03221 [Eleusine coracana subsp. coracana]
MSGPDFRSLRPHPSNKEQIQNHSLRWLRRLSFPAPSALAATSCRRYYNPFVLLLLWANAPKIPKHSAPSQYPLHSPVRC